jgi:hypothetical protein
MADVNLWAIFAASLAHMMLGFLWYHPSVFGAAWMRMSGVTPEMAEHGVRSMGVTIGAGFVAGLVSAAALSYLKNVGGFFGIGETVMLAVLLWFGFLVPVMLGSVLWEQKPFALFLLNTSYWLLSLALMAGIIALLV